MTLYLGSLRVEKRAVGNVDDLYNLILQCGDDMYARMGLDHWRPPTPIEMYREFPASKDVYAVTCDGQLVGTFTLTKEPPEPYPPEYWANPSHRAIYLIKLAVSPDQQGLGLGRWCMDCIEGIARNSGYDAVRLDALTRNAPLLVFYNKLNYKRRGDMQVADEIGRWWDIVLYEKVLH